jgi:hypothetical protein
MCTQHQFCLDYQELVKGYFFDDKCDYIMFKKFQTKYQQTLNLLVDYNYLKSKAINTEEKIIQFLYIVKKIQNELHPFSKNIYSIMEEEEPYELYDIKEE